MGAQRPVAAAPPHTVTVMRPQSQRTQRVPAVIEPWFRAKDRQKELAKAMLESWLMGVRGAECYVAAWTRLWASTPRGIVCQGREIRMVESHVQGRARQGRLVAKVIGRYLAISSRAPRWLKNWARHRPECRILRALNGRALAARLVVEKLGGRADERI